MEKYLDFAMNTRWMYFAYVLPLVVILYRNRLLIREGFVQLIRWSKPSMESGGTASPEKLTAFAVLNLVYIPGRLRFIWTSDDPWHQILGFAMDITFILLLFRIISPREVIELRTGLRLEKKEGQQNEGKV
jgi:hypothetical protein